MIFLFEKDCYLSYFDNSSHHNKWNKRENLFCFVTLLWIIFIYDVVLNNVRAPSEEYSMMWCNVVSRVSILLNLEAWKTNEWARHSF